MISRRTVLGLLASASVAATSGMALAKQEHHKNGHQLLGAKLKQNGKHQIEKVGNATVTAEVNNGKVVGMTATDPQKGNLPVRKLKSKKKMAAIDPGIVRVAATGDTPQLAQDSGIYYAWCFDDGVDLWCYWYPADVVIVDSSWSDYGPV
jgi:hypothetical protein